MKPQQKRIKILGDAEVADLNALPRFSDEERAEHFSLSPQETLLLEMLGSIRSRITFILQSGYFKARHQFFTFDFAAVREDAAYIQARDLEADLSALDVSKVTRLKQRQLILDLSNYRVCGRKEREALETKARHLARISSKPAYLFRELLSSLAQWRIVAPRYTTLQDIISSALSFEQKRLTDLLRANLKEADIALLEKLLDDSQGLHEITQIKRLPKDLSVSDIKGEVRREEELRELYGLAQRLLPNLAISNEGVIYYASLVGYYSAYKLKRLERWTVYVYLLCFIHYRYNRLYDNLIQSLLHHVKRFSDAAKEGAKERVYNCRVTSNRDLLSSGADTPAFYERPHPREHALWRDQGQSVRPAHASAARARGDAHLYKSEVRRDRVRMGTPGKLGGHLQALFTAHAHRRSLCHRVTSRSGHANGHVSKSGVSEGQSARATPHQSVRHPPSGQEAEALPFRAVRAGAPDTGPLRVSHLPPPPQWALRRETSTVRTASASAASKTTSSAAKGGGTRTGSSPRSAYRASNSRSRSICMS